MVHGNFGGRANLKIGAGCLDLGEVRAFFGGGGGGVCGSASLKFPVWTQHLLCQ